MVFEYHNHPHLFDELFAFMYIDALVGGSAKNLASIEVVPDIVRVCRAVRVGYSGILTYLI